MAETGWDTEALHRFLVDLKGLNRKAVIMHGGSIQYWGEQTLTPEEAQAHVAAEYAGKIRASFPGATPEQVTAHCRNLARYAEDSYRRRFNGEPPSDMAGAIEGAYAKGTS